MPTWRVRLIDHEGTVHHLDVDARSSSPTADLIAGLHRLGFDPAVLDGRPLLADTTIGDLGLRHGSLLAEQPEQPYDPTGSLPVAATGSAADTAPPIRELLVLTGSSAGVVIGLRPGRMVLHRSLALEIGPEGRVVLHPSEGPSPVLVEGRVCSDPVELTSDTIVSLGAAAFTVAVPWPPPTHSAGPGPTEPFVRRFRSARTPLPCRLMPPPAPMAADPRGSGWWRSLLPLTTGIGFAVLTGRWEFLVLSALAPLVHVVDGRRRRRRLEDENRRADERHAREQAAFEATVGEVRALERLRRRCDEPIGAVAVQVARHRSGVLWARRPEDTDFGRLTLGLAALAGDLDAGDAHPVDGRPLTWGIPLSASLVDVGALVVSGPGTRARAVLRSLVVGLATTHSPADVEIWILAGGHADGPDGWDFARWLPHVNGPSGVRLALDPRRWARCAAELRTILDSRRTRSTTDTCQPLVVIVIDTDGQPGPDMHGGGSDLHEVVRDGAGHGIVTLSAGDRHGLDGIRAELRLDPHTGMAEFSSRTQPRVTGVLVAELGSGPSLAAALALAPLAPPGPPTPGAASGGWASGGWADPEPPEGRLLGLLGLDGSNESNRLDVDGVLDRWQRRSPSTAVPIGWSGDAVMEVDLVAHGPHGLLAGMSGSGKTELLLTLLTSLCLDNHPEDLAIVVVDFKGGVDHEVTARLPHVVSLSTNLGIDELRRTIVLLDAEQRRRQRLLRGVASDLDGYREARARDGSLPPIPRLLVVVDEFGELLADEAGRQSLHELVSITRIGRALGVHLLLVTQNFEGHLPPQIEANAGLRLCLRVVKAAHSQVVLGSGVAADIPAGAAGWGYARLNGGELTAFRSARVMSGPRAAALPVAVCPSGGDRRVATHSSTPLEHTDAARVARLLQQAAQRCSAGHNGSGSPPVPWPAELPDTIDLVDVFGPHLRGEGTPGLHPVGLEDRPDEQRHHILELAVDDRHLLFVGPPTSGASEALSTIAISASLLHPPAALHLFGLDLDGSGLGRLAALPHCGAVATRDEALAGRILEHVHREVDRRRSRPGPHPRLILLVTGGDRLIRRGDDPRSTLLSPLLALAADTLGTGVQILVAGQTSIIDSRLGSLAERHFRFDRPASSSRSLLALDSSSGRRVLFARVGPGHDRLVRRMRQRFATGGDRDGPARIRTVAWPLPMTEAPVDPPPYGDRPMTALGVDTSTGSVVWVDGAEDGPLIVVTGPPRSGRSTALASIALLARARGMAAVALAGSRRSPIDRGGVLGTAFDLHLGPDLDPRSAIAALRRLPADQPALLFIDDAHRLSCHDLDLGGMTERFHLIFLAGPADFVDGRSDTRRQLPPHRSGLVLCPTSALDGAAIGLRRLDEGQRCDPRPGRGLLSLGGDCFNVQILDPT